MSVSKMMFTGDATAGLGKESAAPADFATLMAKQARPTQRSQVFGFIMTLN
jgi:hypothetical protein